MKSYLSKRYAAVPQFIIRDEIWCYCHRVLQLASVFLARVPQVT
jgi:hypothetical protein